MGLPDFRWDDNLRAMPAHNNQRRTRRWSPIPTVTALALTAGTATPSWGQGPLFPDVTPFEYPLASPRVSGIVGRLLDLTRGDSRYGSEREAEAGIGETVPVVAISRGRLPVHLSLAAEVYGRFSLDDPRSALISNDWVVGVHATGDLSPRWRVDLHAYHESSHLGDEYAERFGALRVDWTREVASLWVRYTTGVFRFHGNFSYTLVDGLHLAPPAAAVAVDFRGRPWRFLGARLAPLAGVYSEGAAYSHWKVTSAVRVGVELEDAKDRRGIGLSIIYLNGLSTQRQFFRAKSQYVGVELRFDL